MNLTYLVLGVTLYIAVIVTLLRVAGINHLDPLDDSPDERRCDWHMRQAINQILRAARATGDLVAANNAMYQRGVPDAVRRRVMAELKTTLTT
ncbi:MAG: hypothetical protein H6948_16235 [Zoogloeaceae bacterium]|nr:hypothetical protein [Zoogloeaceae bacterium]